MRSEFEIYKCVDANGIGYRWRLKGGNGEIMASGEPHPTEELARKAITRIKLQAPFARVTGRLK